MEEFKPCPQCSGNPVPGYYSDNGHIKECSCRQAYEQKTIRMLYLENSGIYLNYLNYDISAYKVRTGASPVEEKLSLKNIQILQKIVETAQEFSSRGCQFYIYGPNNTQKTSVATWVTRGFIQQGVTAHFLTMAHLVSIILRSGEFEETPERDLAREMLVTVKDVDLLVTDESFDPSKLYMSASNYKATLLDDFFRDRFHSCKANGYISNIPKTSINADLFGESLIKMLSRNCIDLQFKDVLGIKDMTDDFLSNLVKGGLNG